ncbi:MAG: TldD/PmbA family protein [Clostridia bacterium]|nr:TldD/PmbA family protein [Clostridia bacterium]
MNEKFFDILLEKAKEAGFEKAEVYAVSGESFAVSVFNGEIDAYNVNSSTGISFRGLYGGKMGYSYSEIADDAACEMLINKAIESAKSVENDDIEFIYDGGSEYADGSAAYNDSLNNVSAQQKIDIAFALEKAAKACDKRVKTVAYNRVSTVSSSVVIKNTQGLDLKKNTNYFVIVVGPVVEDNGLMYNGSAFKMGHDILSVDIDALAKDAVNDALAYIGAKQPKSGKYKAIMRNDVLCTFMQTFSSVFSAENAQKGLSLLAGKEGEKVASDIFTLRDEPMREGCIGISEFDDEGVPTVDKSIIENGVLKTLLHNLKTANKQGVKPTGNGAKAGYKSPVGISAVIMTVNPGEKDLEGLAKDMGDGIIITDISGLHAGANAVSGDFSLLSKGFEVKDGVITGPLEQMTIAGNFFEVLKNIVAVGSDMYTDIGSAMLIMPSVMISEIAVAGE